MPGGVAGGVGSADPEAEVELDTEEPHEPAYQAYVKMWYVD